MCYSLNEELGCQPHTSFMTSNVMKITGGDSVVFDVVSLLCLVVLPLQGTFHTKQKACSLQKSIRGLIRSNSNSIRGSSTATSVVEAHADI